MDDKLTFYDGEIVQITGRHEDLKKPDGSEFPYVIRQDDILYILENKGDSLIVEFREDILHRLNGYEHQYGPFVVPVYLLKSKEDIMETRRLVTDL